MDGRTGRDKSGDHGDWQVARWRPQRRQSQAEFTGAGRTRWRPQTGNHKEVDRLSTGLVLGTLIAEVETSSLESGMTRKSKASSQKETERNQ